MKTTITDTDKGWKALQEYLKAQAPEGPHVKVGVLGASATAAHASSKLTNVEIAGIHEFGRGKVPERSFIRSAFDSNKPKYENAMRKLADKVLTQQMTPRVAMGVLGQMIQSDVQKRFEDGIPPPLKDSTITRRFAMGYKSTKPLIVTSQLKNSITYETVDV